MAIGIHANPGFGRVELLNSDWQFNLLENVEGKYLSIDNSKWENVELPHDWSIKLPASPDKASATGYLPGGIAWYRKTLSIPKTEQANKVYIYFEGVYNNSEVFINGQSLGKRPNGYVSFMYDMTPYLKFGEDNEVTVKVDHSKDADSRWYTGSGIYRDVYLVYANPIHVDLWGVYYKLDKITTKKADVSIQTTIKNTTSTVSEVEVLQEISDITGKIVVKNNRKLKVPANNKTVITQNITLSSPKRWSLETPYLYTLTTSIKKNNEIIETSNRKMGLRTLSFDANDGFALNGVNMKVKGVCLHHDAGSLGAAVPREIWKNRLKTLKQIGVNAIRMSHNPQAPIVYELCDEMGFLIMDEAFDEWEFPKKKWLKGWNVGTPGFQGSYEYFEKWSERDVEAMVLRDRNHPSVIIWSIGNEVDYPNDPYSHPILDKEGIGQQHERGFNPNAPHANRIGDIAKKLVPMVKKHDMSRPVTGALAGPVMSNETDYPGILDIVGYNYTESRYQMDHQKYPKRILYGSENRHDLEAWKAVRDNKFIFGQFLWTGFDYLGEAGRWPSRGFTTGLADLAGFIKPLGYFRQSLWSDIPMAYIGTYRIDKGHEYLSMYAEPTWNYRNGEIVRVACYTNCEEAELLLNGKLTGERKKYDDNTGILYWDMPYQPGKLTVRGFNSNKQVVENTIRTTGRPYALRAESNKNGLHTDKDLAIVTIHVVDELGNEVWFADDNITCQIDGPAKLLGMENGAPDDMGDWNDNIQRACRGRLVCYIQSTKKEGEVFVNFSAPWLKTTRVSFAVSKK